MQTGGGSFAAAVTAQDQTVDYKVTIGFPAGVQTSYQDVSKCVVSIDKDRSVTSAFSQQATLVSGSASAQATVTLAGLLNQNPGVALVEAQNIAWLFNRNDPTSPMRLTTCAGLDITIQEGLWDGGSTADLITTFTGTIDIVSISNGVVTLTCRDRRSSVTSQASLPPVDTQVPFNAGMTSEYAMEHLLRYASPMQYLTRPVERANCVLSAGGRSSLWPDVGTYQPNTFPASPATYIPGNFGSAVSTASTGNGGLGEYTLATPILQSNSIFIENFISNGATYELILDDNPLVQTIVLAFIVDPTGIELDVFAGTSLVGFGSARWTVTTTGHKYVAIQIAWAAGTNNVSGTMYLDSTPHLFSFSVVNGATAVNRPAASIIEAGFVMFAGGIEALQITTETAGGSSLNNAFAPTAVLDPSLNPLTALPDVTGQDDWSAIQDMAVAEAGVFLFDEPGTARFVNRNTIAAKTPVRTVTSAKSLVSVDNGEQMSLCATHIQVPYTPRSVKPYTTVWNTGDTILIGAGSRYVTVAHTSDPIVNLGTTCGLIPSGGLVSGSGYRASRGKDGSGSAVTNITMTVAQTGPTSVLVTVRNPNSFPVWLVSPQGTTYPDASDGLPMLAIGAQPVTAGNDPDGTSSVAGGSSADAQWPDIDSGGAITNQQFGEILYPAPDSDWRQDGDAAQTLANDLLSDLHYPKPIWRNVQIIPDPRLQLLDAITITDPDVSQLDDDGLIIGITTSIAAGAYTQELDVLALYRPGAWELGVSTLGVDNYLY